MAHSCLQSSDSISYLESVGVRYVGMFIYQSTSALLHLGKSTTSQSLRVECFQLSLDTSGELCVSSSFIYSPSSLQVSGRPDHRSFQTFSSDTLFDRGSLASHSLQPIGRHSSSGSFFPHLIKYDFIDWVLKGLPLLHLTLWLFRDVHCAYKRCLPQSVRLWQGWLKCL